jgi:hypothetical protein
MRVVPLGRYGGLSREEGLQLGNLVIGARDGRFAGDPRHRSLRVRLLAVYPSLGAERQGQRRGADRPGGRPGGHRPGLGPPVPGHDRTAPAGLLPAAARAVAVQSPPAPPDAADHPRAARHKLGDGTLLSCANYAGCAARSEFAGAAAYGYCAAKSRWYWGVRLLLVSDRRGVPLGYDLRPANENEREGVFTLAGAHPGSLLFADAGHRGREHSESLRLVGVELVVPDKHRLGERPPAEIMKARIRLVIESVFATLKRQMRMEDHLAKTLPGLAQRIVQRLLALTLGMFLNRLLGRPPRALAAYDGR